MVPSHPLHSYYCCPPWLNSEENFKNRTTQHVFPANFQRSFKEKLLTAGVKTSHTPPPLPPTNLQQYQANNFHIPIPTRPPRLPPPARPTPLSNSHFLYDCSLKAYYPKQKIGLSILRGVQTIRVVLWHPKIPRARRDRIMADSFHPAAIKGCPKPNI